MKMPINAQVKNPNTNERFTMFFITALSSEFIVLDNHDL